jgi:hypothetical protein
MGVTPTHDTEPWSPKAQDNAFATYVLPEVQVLRRVPLRLTAQPADAEDLVQDTLLRAYKAIGHFDGRYPRAWLLAIRGTWNSTGGAGVLSAWCTPPTTTSSGSQGPRWPTRRRN